MTDTRKWAGGGHDQPAHPGHQQTTTSRRQAAAAIHPEGTAPVSLTTEYMACIDTYAHLAARGLLSELVVDVLCAILEEAGQCA